MIATEKCKSPSEICFMTAGELVRCLQKKELSAREVMEAHLRQIEEINPKVNAIVTLVAEQAMEEAVKLDNSAGNDKNSAPLYGLPVAHKDLLETGGIRTTYGSLLYRDFIPSYDNLPVERLKKGGAITIGKTNTSEFGAGCQTFNNVFGKTLNPYDINKTCGGSSGGSAVALACGMVTLASGSDCAGSLRNPASFCNVVGFRPSPGRVPVWSEEHAWNSLTVVGPMGRTVSDVALMLSVMAGPDSRTPIAICDSLNPFSHSLERDFKGTLIAWASDLGGLPFEPVLKKIVDEQQKVFESLGCVVEINEPDFGGADEAYKIWRAWDYEVNLGKKLKSCRNIFKDTLCQNIEEGKKLCGVDLAHAERLRTKLFHRIRVFMEKYEFFILPVTQVMPFDVTQEYITKIQDTEMATYIDWQKSCYYISLTGNPAISVPCGFSPEGLPAGIQIVGRYNDDFGVLQLARAFEEATGIYKRRPPVI